MSFSLKDIKKNLKNISKQDKIKIAAGTIIVIAAAVVFMPHEQKIYMQRQNLDGTYEKKEVFGYSEKKHMFQTMLWTSGGLDYTPVTVRYMVMKGNTTTVKTPRKMVILKIEGKQYFDLRVNGKLIQKHIKKYNGMVVSGSRIKISGYGTEPVTGIIRGYSTLIQTAPKGQNVTIIQGDGKINKFENAVSVPVVIHSKKEFSLYVNGNEEATKVKKFNQKIKEGSGIQIAGEDIDTVFGTVGNKQLDISVSGKGKPVYIDEGGNESDSKDTRHHLDVSGEERFDIYLNGILKGKNVKYAEGTVKKGDIIFLKGKNINQMRVKVADKDISIVTAPKGKSPVITTYTGAVSASANSSTSDASTGSGFKSGNGKNGNGSGSDSDFVTGDGKNTSAGGSSSTFSSGNGKSGSKKGEEADFTSENGKNTSKKGKSSDFTTGNGKYTSSSGKSSNFTTSEGNSGFSSSSERSKSGINGYRSTEGKSEKSKSGVGGSKTSGSNTKSSFSTGSGSYIDYGSTESTFTNGKASFNNKTSNTQNRNSSLISDTVTYQYINSSKITSHGKGSKFLVQVDTPEGYNITGIKYNGKTYARTYLFTQTASPMRFTVVMAPITYSVDYFDAYNHSNSLTYTIRSSISLKNPSRPGYKFVGWYKNGKRVTEIRGTGNVSVTAKWEKK